MKRLFWLLFLLSVIHFPVAAADIPKPPDVTGLSGFVSRLTGDGNAADHFLAAEKVFLKDHDRKEIERPVDEDDEAFRLVEKGLGCGRCEFPYSATMAIPPYEQMIPMMSLYRSVVKRFRLLGDAALAKKDFATAEHWYGHCLVLGLMLWNEPGITIIQDMISMSCLSEGAEGLGDLAISRGDPDRAALCARFLAEKTAYLDALPLFVRDTLRGGMNYPAKVSDSFRQVADVYETIDYNPLKLEILLAASEIVSFHKDKETLGVCARILGPASRDPDPRIRAVAEWTAGLSKEDMKSLLDQYGTGADEVISELKRRLDQDGGDDGK
ncbi:hypothetical protein JW905_14175 [bacterium]|nr:hypothetical protein [candidate division CSSED10-310 bacterium]